MVMQTNLLCTLVLIFLSVVCLVSAEQGTSTEAARAYQIGLQALVRKEDRTALTAFQEAIKLDASHAEAHYQLGLLYGKQSQWKPGDSGTPECY